MSILVRNLAEDGTGNVFAQFSLRRCLSTALWTVVRVTLLPLKNTNYFYKRRVTVHTDFDSFRPVTQKETFTESRCFLYLFNIKQCIKIKKQAAGALMHTLLFPYCIFQTTCESVPGKDLVCEAGNPGTLFYWFVWAQLFQSEFLHATHWKMW